jgi:uncharacterized MAPEG superfamily protein
MNSPILAPAAVLVLWSLIMLMWAAATRFPAMGKVPADVMKTLPQVGGRGNDLDPILPAKVAWKSHNYTHLMEQPTIYYATVVILALSGAGDGLNLTLAWAYTGLRIAHSIWQATVNTVLPVRFVLFLLSTICLVMMAVNAVRITLGA